jgi:hypothetical protein
MIRIYKRIGRGVGMSFPLLDWLKGLAVIGVLVAGIVSGHFVKVVGTGLAVALVFRGGLRTGRPRRRYFMR